MMESILFGAAVFFLVGTGLSLFRHDHWTIRLFDFPWLQLTVGGTLGGLR